MGFEPEQVQNRLFNTRLGRFSTGSNPPGFTILVLLLYRPTKTPLFSLRTESRISGLEPERIHRDLLENQADSLLVGPPSV